MDVKVDFENMQIIVSYQDANELGKLMAKLGEFNPSSAPSPKNNVVNNEKTKDSDNSTDELKYALSLLRGSRSASFVQLLAENLQGLTDSSVKEGLKMSSKQNLGPIIAHISKCCNKAGIPRESIYIQKSKKGRDKKMAYFYQLTDEAAEIVRNIENFEEEEFESAFDF